MAVTHSQTHFAQASSESEHTQTPAQEERSVVEPTRDPWLVRAIIALGRPAHPRVIDRPLPEITPSLALRVQQVSAAIEHARENAHLKWAPELLKAQEIYTGAIRDALRSIKQRDSRRFYNLSQELSTKPVTLDEVQDRLSLEFSLQAQGSSNRYFHFRNNVASLYEKTLRKAGITITPRIP